MIDISKAELIQVTFPDEIPVKVFVKRLDLIHPIISGNKWFKQKYNLVYAKENDYKTLVTFGGAYSNHIHALAASGKEFGFETIGLIRGEEHLPLNPTLKAVTELGMKIFYVSRSDYRKKHLPEFEEWINKKFGKVYIVPEGGTNVLALKGGSEIPSLIEMDYDFICSACGTAGTIAGVIAGLDGNKKALGFSVLRGGAFLNNNVKNLISAYNGKAYTNWSINLDYHFGGYAKINRELILFIQNFYDANMIQLDPIYTGKMMYGIYHLGRNGYFGKDKTIIALHTGGLQGVEGMIEKMKNVLANKVR